MLKNFDHLTIVVRDVERAKAFFAVLGFKEAMSVVIAPHCGSLEFSFAQLSSGVGNTRYAMMELLPPAPVKPRPLLMFAAAMPLTSVP